MGQKPRKRNAKRKTVRWWLTVMFFFIGELFAYTWCRVQCVHTGYDITKAAEEQRQLLAVRQNLMVEMARLRSPERIERISRQKLGLVSPTPEQIIVIPSK